ncbi:unnamed protein product [Kuraishia capsulata CBS 1993]|uniref:Transcription factor MBP1 n=1 Tax=Kuraishia capsulata CBS 1993 TaxID=1382522 RepID=W6MXW0_9ASCO|nr:uncharacterized protein KUCA_T00005562001 [Kuraishia capsulata CBS 1993]CDK29570.1 unnamed protein product [Kuraishia capsulata CBS 1993]
MSDQVYSATYSGVPVFEFITPKTSVMRRQQDGWINATHILKVADFPKAKRTRILERDVQTGTHEKIQGGYGKYQGTWVPLERAREIAVQFGVDGELSAIFDFAPNAGDPPPPPAPKHHHASSATKPKKPERLEKPEKPALRRMVRPGAESPTNALSASIPRKRGRPPKSRENSTVDEPAARNAVATNRHEQYRSIQQHSRPRPLYNDYDADEPNSHLELSSSPSEFMSDTDLDNALRSHQDGSGQVALRQSTHPTEAGWYDPGKEYTSRLLEYFLAPPERPQEVPEFLLHPTRGFDVNQPIDKEGNTTFHWACSMGDLRISDALLNYGANYRCLNHAGQVPAMRAVLFTNAFARRTFPKLLDLLRDTLLDRDSRGRTMLHHIAASSDSRARLPAARYYLDALLAKVSEIQPLERLSNFVNQQDAEGNTALHVFVLSGAKKCVKVMLGYGARVDISNEHGETVYDFLSTASLRPDLESVETLQSFPSLNFNVPRYSETAMQINHRVSSQLSEKLLELSSAFDAELQQTDDDLSESRAQLAGLEEDVRTTNVEIGVIVARHDKGMSVAAQLVELGEQYAQKSARLRSLLERAQAKDLAEVVQRCEGESGAGPQSVAATVDATTIASVVELSRLQLSRKRKVEEIVTLFAEASGESEKMNQYRRLVSLCCSVELEEVDGLLDGIAEALQSVERE